VVLAAIVDVLGFDLGMGRVKVVVMKLGGMENSQETGDVGWGQQVRELSGFVGERRGPWRGIGADEKISGPRSRCSSINCGAGLRK
jgi:hypothetical protein